MRYIFYVFVKRLWSKDLLTINAQRSGTLDFAFSILGNTVVDSGVWQLCILYDEFCAAQFFRDHLKAPAWNHVTVVLSPIQLYLFIYLLRTIDLDLQVEL